MEDFPDLGWLGDLGSKPVERPRRLKPIVETLAMVAVVVISTASQALEPWKGNDCNNTSSDDCVTTETPRPLRL